MEFIGKTQKVYEAVAIATQRENTNKKPGVIITNAIVDGVKIETKSEQLDRKPGFYAVENVKEFLEDTKTQNVAVIFTRSVNQAVAIADDLVAAVPPKKKRKTIGESRSKDGAEGTGTAVENKK